MQSLLAFVIYKCGDKCHSTGATWRYEAARAVVVGFRDYTSVATIVSLDGCDLAVRGTTFPPTDCVRLLSGDRYHVHDVGKQHASAVLAAFRRCWLS